MKKIAELAGAVGAKLRDRTRSTRACLMQHRPRQPQPRRAGQGADAAVLRQAARPSPGAWWARPSASCARWHSGVKHGACVLDQAGIEAERQLLQTMIPRVQQVMRQTRERIFKGNTHARGQDRQPVRAAHRDHPQGQGRQAHRVRQDGQDPGSRTADRHALRGLRRAAQRLGSAGPRARRASSSSSAGRPAWSPPMLDSSRRATKPTAHARGVKRVAIPNARHQERRAQDSCRRSAGSATRRSGAPAAKAASAC